MLNRPAPDKENAAWLLERLHHESTGGSPDLIAQNAIANPVNGKTALPPLFALASGRKNGRLITSYQIIL
ncbi:MAG TPA: hypothetical protein VMT12_07300 [Syntrophales bacterium]|nr:hypothetical protein [Syntrophales bacterium]